MVCGAVFELVKVLETTPKVLVDPRGGALAASAEAETAKSAISPAVAPKLVWMRSMANLPFSIWPTRAKSRNAA